MSIGLTQLRAFVAVVDKRSFSSAARALGISQPAVTLQIQSLEQHLGTTLLERRYKSVGMTEAGEALYPAATGILSRWAEAEDRIRALEGLVGGRLVVGGSTTPAHYILPRLVGAFKRDHPETTVVLKVADTRDTIDRLTAGDVDVAFVGEQVRDRRLECEPFGTDELVLIAAPDAEIGGTRPAARSRGRGGSAPLALSELVRLPFVFREEGSATRDVIEQHLGAHGVSPGDLDVVLELGTSEAVVNAVESGLGLSVVSRFAAAKPLALGSVVELAAESFPVSRELFMCTLKRGTPRRAVAAFVDFARAHGPD